MKENDITELKAMLDQYSELVNAGDLDSWISIWEEDGVQMQPDTPARVGIECIKEGMRPFFEEMTIDVTFSRLKMLEYMVI